MTYETDFYAWTQEQVSLLRQGQLTAVDLEHLIEEVEDMGRSRRDALRSFLRNVLIHLLKWQFQPERRGTSWQVSIDNGRDDIAWQIKNNPSLCPQVPVLLESVYLRARRNAAAETGLPLATFPETCPYTVEQVIGEWWPE